MRRKKHVLIFVYAGIMNIEYDNKKFSVKSGQYVFLKRDHLIRLYKTSYKNETYKAINLCLSNKVLIKYANNHRETIKKIHEKTGIIDSAFILS